nr:pilus (MSHA type) biogenesis protein MshL [Bowmanella sp. JS7-9]
MAMLTSCQSTYTEKGMRQADEAITDAIANQPQQPAAALPALPADVLQALMPANNGSDSDLYGEPRYDISAENVEASAFFAGLVADTPYSVAIHPNVSGKITLDLKQVSLTELFSLVTDIYGYDIQRSGTVYRIYPAGMRTETFTVNYLLMQRDGSTRSTISSGGVSQAQNGSQGSRSSNGQNFATQSALGGTGSNQNSAMMGGNQSVNGTNITTRTNTDFWADLKETLGALIGQGEGRSVVVSPQAGLVTVRAMPEELRAIREYLSTTEQHVQRQVVLEARIIEVVLDDEFQQGINWQQIMGNISSTNFTLSTGGQVAGNTISAALGGITSLSIVNQDFSGVLQLLDTQGNVQVLSSPRVTATNNQKAVFKVGDDEYFVTDISSQVTSTATATSSAPDIQLTPFFSGIALDVTPQINESGQVMLHVHPSVIDTREQEKVLKLNDEQIVLPLAQSNIRESDTVIRANSGEIVVIGGLMQTIIRDSESQTPLLGDIPILGHLFKNKKQQELKKELVILIKPTVVGQDTWQQQLLQTQRNIKDWSRGG